MRILYLTDPAEDYLQDQLLLGLRHLFGPSVVDYPRKDVMYADCTKPPEKMYGRGFTVWKQLDEIDVERTDVERKVRRGFFDLIIFGSVRRQTLLLSQYFVKGLLTGASRGRYLFLDGQDGTRALSVATPFGSYFKREQRPKTARQVLPINFSMPDGKILSEPPVKHKRFARHVQCREAYELQEVREHCRDAYLFDNEESYYEDLACSQYGITMKKQGWDCMRHYEIAANHTVPVFFELDRKPDRCAPHGLRDMENVVAFNTARELSEKLDRIERDGLYPQLQRGAVAWVRHNSCRSVASRLVAFASAPSIST